MRSLRTDEMLTVEFLLYQLHVCINYTHTFYIHQLFLQLTGSTRIIALQERETLEENFECSLKKGLFI